MGTSDSLSADPAVENRSRLSGRGAPALKLAHVYGLIVVLVSVAVFFGTIISPPSLMDDSDAVLAQIPRNMVASGDWVSATLDGIPFLEKPPLKHWMIAVSYLIFGVHDWAARIPVALMAVLLCWVTMRFGVWAFSPRVGLVAGLSLATCVGLFLFTRILIPDASLTLAVTLTVWGFLRALDEEEEHPRFWAAVMAASLGAGLLLKGLIAAVSPCGAALVYLLVTRRLFRKRTWQRLRPFSGALIVLAIAAPWHVLATLRNPPYFDFTMRSEPGQYHGFFWFYFMNEHVLRFLNLRHPRDYNTVPRLYFWLFHLLWLFPWSVFFPAAAKLKYQPVNRAGRARLMCLCWAGFLLAFFTFSTTQEYYTLPIYPALALLIGCATAEDSRWVRIGTKLAGAISAIAAAAVVFILVRVWNLPTPGDIASALTSNPDVYTLSLGHMRDLTLDSFAYLRLPLAMAGIAFVIGAAGSLAFHGRKAFIALVVMMILFVHAARQAMVVFDPYLSSRPLAEALKKAPPGKLIVDDQYYAFSSVFFYANRTALLLNGRVNNLEYGSYAPGAPNVFIKDPEFQSLWNSRERYYLTAAHEAVPRLEGLVGKQNLHAVLGSGGKYLFTNLPLGP